MVVAPFIQHNNKVLGTRTTSFNFFFRSFTHSFITTAKLFSWTKLFYFSNFGWRRSAVPRISRSFYFLAYLQMKLGYAFLLLPVLKWRKCKTTKCSPACFFISFVVLYTQKTANELFQKQKSKCFLRKSWVVVFVKHFKFVPERIGYVRWVKFTFLKLFKRMQLGFLMAWPTHGETFHWLFDSQLGWRC